MSAPWSLLPFVALDLETTGLEPDRDRIIEVGWARFDAGRLCGRGSSLVQPGRPLPPVVAELCGLSDDDLASAPPFDQIAAGVVALLEEASFVVAYNAAFDRAFLHRALLRAGLRLPERRFLDPLLVLRRVDPDPRGHRLSEVAPRFGVRIDRPHRAISDAEAAGELFLRAASHLEATTLDELVAALSALATAPRA